MLGASLPRIYRTSGVLGLAFVLCFLGATSGESRDLNGFVRSTGLLTESEAENTTSELRSLTNTLDLNWNRAISSFFRYRVSLRTQDTRGQTKVNGESTNNSSTLVEPIADVTLARAAYSLNAGVRLRELISNGSDVERVRLSDRRIFGRFFLTPERLPSLSFQVDRLTSQDDLDPRQKDTADTRLDFTTDYTWKSLNLGYRFENRVFEDNAAGFTRNRQQHVGSFAYSDSLFQNQLRLNADYTADYAGTTEEFSRSAAAAIERQLRRGLRAGADSTPDDSSDVPLVDEPGLLTGAASLPLELSTSVGFELVVRESVAEIRIALAPEPPFILPGNLQLFVNFRLFSTDDTTLTTWTEVAGVSQRFEFAESRFILTFSATTARAFKVFVGRNDFGALVKATQIVALDVGEVGAGVERKRTILLQSFRTGLAYSPVAWTTGSFDAFVTDTTDNPGSRRTTNGTLTTRLTADLHRLLTGAFTYQHGFTTSNAPGSENTLDDSFSLVFNSRPLPTLTGSLALFHRQDRAEGQLRNRSETATLTGSAELYRNLNTITGYSISRSEDFEAEQDLLSHRASLDATARLTDKLTSTLGYAFQWTDAEGPLQSGTSIMNTANASFVYTLSRLANFTARFDFSDTPNATTFTQQYTIDWIPTSKMSSFLSYRRVTQDVQGNRTGSDAVSANGRWNLSPYVNLDGNVIFFRSFDGAMSFSITGSVQLRF